MPNFDLIAFDLDGTVFPTPPLKREVNGPVARAFQSAHDAGVRIVVASGRPRWMLGEQSACAPWLDWRILLNGSRVEPARQGKTGRGEARAIVTAGRSEMRAAETSGQSETRVAETSGQDEQCASTQF